MSVIKAEISSVTLEVDEERYREYKATYKVTTDDRDDGPFVVLGSPLLPPANSIWFFGNDLDIWVWCKHSRIISKREDDDSRDKYWFVECIFSNRPTEQSQGSCDINNIENPIDRPARWSGSFFKYTETGVYDRFGVPILTSSHEQIFGPANEWDKGRPVIRVEFNVPLLDLALLCAMIDTVNSDVIWGMAARTVKLSQINWQENWYGCSCYYTLQLEFEVNFDTWDRDVLDEGTKVLSGQWINGWYQLVKIGEDNPVEPDPNNPAHFIRAEDPLGNPTKLLLDGGGLPADAIILESDGYGTSSNPVANINIQKYYGADFFLLGVPMGLCGLGADYTSIIKSSATGEVSLSN